MIGNLLPGAHGGGGTVFLAENDRKPFDNKDNRKYEKGFER